VIKNHSITQVKANKLNDLVREIDKCGILNPQNFNVLQKQAIGINASGGIGALNPADEDSRMLLLHFSMSELKQLEESSSSMTALLARLISMHNRTIFATVTSGVAAVLMLIVCCVDAIYAQGSFSTLLLALSLLLLAYSLYEVLRVVALVEVQRRLKAGCWTVLQLSTLFKVVMQDFEERGSSVFDDLKRVAGDESEVENESSNAFTLICPVQYRGYREVNVEVESNHYSASIFSRMIGTDSYFGLALLFSCSIFLCFAILLYDLNI